MEKNLLSEYNKSNLKEKLKAVLKLNMKFYKNINFDFKKYIEYSIEFINKNKNNIRFYTFKNFNSFRFKTFNLYENNIFVNYNNLIIICLIFNILFLFIFNYKLFGKNNFSFEEYNKFSLISIVFYILIIVFERYLFFLRHFRWYNYYNFSDKLYNRYKENLNRNAKLKLFFYLKIFYVCKILRNKSRFKKKENFESSIMINKLKLTIFTLIYSLVLIFYLIPSENYFIMTENMIYLNIFWIINVFYFIFSILQIKSGNSLILNIFKEGKNINNLFVIKHLIINFIPFVKEINIAIKYFAANTSLSIFEWFKIEDIKNELRQSNINEHRILKRKTGEKLGKFYKTFLGIFLGWILYLILFLPLIISSVLNYYSSKNFLDFNLRLDVKFNLKFIKDSHINQLNLVYLKGNKDKIDKLKNKLFVFNYLKNNNINKDLFNIYPNLLKNWIHNKINYDDLELKWNIEIFKIKDKSNTLLFTKDYEINEMNKNILIKFWNGNKENINENLVWHLFKFNNNFYLVNNNLVEKDVKKKLSDYFVKIIYNNDGYKMNLIESKNSDNHFKLNLNINFENLYSEKLSFINKNKSFSIFSIYTIIILYIGMHMFKNKLFNRTHKWWTSEITNCYKIKNIIKHLEYMQIKGNYRQEKKDYSKLIEIFRDPTKLKEITGSILNKKLNYFKK